MWTDGMGKPSHRYHMFFPWEGDSSEGPRITPEFLPGSRREKLRGVKTLRPVWLYSSAHGGGGAWGLRQKGPTFMTPH